MKIYKRLRQSLQRVPLMHPYIALAVMLLLLLLPSLAIIIVDEMVRISPFNITSYILLASLLVGLPVALGGRRGVHWILAFCMLWLPFECACLLIAKSPVSFGLVQATLQTNPGEASELFGIYIVIAVITLSIWGVFFWAFKSWHRTPAKISPLIRWTILGAFFLYLLGIGSQLYRIYPPTQSWRERVIGTAFKTYTRVAKVYPLDIWHNSLFYCSVRLRELRLCEELGEGNFQVLTSPVWDKRDKPHELPIILFVIGETGSAAHWQMLGYPRATNPYLSKERNLILFSNATSAADLTSISIPLMLSASTPQHYDRWQHEGTLIHLFRKAGFATAWLSNQASQFACVEVSVPLMDFHYSAGGYGVEQCYDEALLPPLDLFLSQVEEEQRAAFVVLHTMGAHFRYDGRVEESYDYFKPTTRGLSTVMALDRKHRAELINSYDNALRYTDFFLSRVTARIHRMERPALFVYAPDHGEGLGEINPMHLLHGSEWPLKDELHVPVVVVYNEAYARLYPQYVDRMQARKDLPFSTASLPNLLQDLVDVKQVREVSSLVDSLYNPEPRYYLSPSLQVRSADKVFEGDEED